MHPMNLHSFLAY